jgi:hypothetical protein
MMERVEVQRKKRGWKRYVMSAVDAGNKLHPFLILECSPRVVRKMKKASEGGYLWVYLADLLHEKYTKEFPSYYADPVSARVNWFWYNLALETYERAYKRIVDEITEEYLMWCGGNVNHHRYCAKIKAEEKLSQLPVYVLD